MWLARTGGAAFDDARQCGIDIVVGAIERGRDAGHGTLWCTALSIAANGDWLAHRRLLLGGRQNLDATGHYDCSDVFKIEVDRRRGEPISFSE